MGKCGDSGIRVSTGCLINWSTVLEVQKSGRQEVLEKLVSKHKSPSTVQGFQDRTRVGDDSPRRVPAPRLEHWWTKKKANNKNRIHAHQTRWAPWEGSEKAGISFPAASVLGTYLVYPPLHTFVSLDSVEAPEMETVSLLHLLILSARYIVAA